MKQTIKTEEKITNLPWDTEENFNIVKSLYGKDMDEDDFKAFWAIAKSTRLDPMQRQIYPVTRWDSSSNKNKMTIQTGIDGYRVIAANTGVHAGTDDAIFDDDNAMRPKWARVTVKKLMSNGLIADFSATARWAEYVQTKKDGTPTSFWKRMPFGQLAKCAEALALRKAFPNSLSGIYTTEEMSQASNENNKIDEISTRDNTLINKLEEVKNLKIVSNLKLEEELILAAEKEASKGTEKLRAWYKNNTSSEEKEIFKKHLEYFVKKAKEFDELNQDL